MISVHLLSDLPINIIFLTGYELAKSSLHQDGPSLAPLQQLQSSGLVLSLKSIALSAFHSVFQCEDIYTVTLSLILLIKL